MKVLLIAASFLPRVGGRELYQDRVLTQFAPEEVVVVTPDREGDYAAFDQGYRFRVVRCGERANSWFARGRRDKALWFAGLAQLCRREKPDVVLCETVLPDGMTGWLLGRTLGKPYVVHAMGRDLAYAASNPWTQARLRAMAATASAFIAISPFMGRFLVKQGVPSERVAVVVPGVNPAFLKEDDGSAERVREQYGLRGKRVIVTVSRIVERKGQDKVIEAMPAILERVPEAVYLVAGEGPDRTRLEVLARQLGVEQHVVFTGQVPYEQAPAFYSAAEVFVMPNREMPGDIEGFGIVFLEANARGLPVIGGRSGGAQDAVEDGVSGLLVDPFSSEDVARALIRLLTDADLARRLGEGGRHRVLTQFSWERAAAQVRAVVEKAAAKPTADWQKGALSPVRRTRRAIETVFARDDVLLQRDGDVLYRPAEKEG